MLKIGDFSRLAHVTVKTLRHYEAIGLFAPAWTDRYSGYRFYKLDQLPRINRILALKDLGFPLIQICDLLKRELPPEQLRAILQQRQQELAAEVEQERLRLTQVENRIQQIECEGCLPEVEVVVKTAPAVFTASLRDRAASLSILGQCVPVLQHRITDWLTDQRVKPAGLWMTINHNVEYREKEFDFEVAVTVDELPQTTSRTAKAGEVRAAALPAADTLACLVMPRLEPLHPDVYASLIAWADQNACLPAGPVRELHLEDQEQPASAYVEIQLPLESAAARKRKFYMSHPAQKENEMEPKIVTKSAFMVVGMRYFGKNENQEIKDMWDKFIPVMCDIRHLTGKEESFGLCTMVDDVTDGSFEYIAGLEVTAVDELPEGMVARMVPEQTYAVFAHVGELATLRQTYHYIQHTWLPASEYKYGKGPDFEFYDENWRGFTPDSKLYLYIPIEKK